MVTCSAIAIGACSSSSSPAAPGPDASVADAQSEDAGGGGLDAGTDSGGVCHSLTNETTGVTTEVVSGDPPSPIGGTIADGIYHFTHLRTYVGDSGAAPAASTVYAAWQISGTALKRVRRDAPDTVDHRDTLTIVASGTSFSTTLDCQDPVSMFPNPAGTYSVNGNDLVVIYPTSGGITTTVTFTQQ